MKLSTKKLLNSTNLYTSSSSTLHHKSEFKFSILNLNNTMQEDSYMCWSRDWASCKTACQTATPTISWSNKRPNKAQKAFLLVLCGEFHFITFKKPL